MKTNAQGLLGPGNVLRINSEGDPRFQRRRNAPDWEGIERDYRTGVKSVRQLAKEFGLSHTAIRKRAEAEDWPRDLAGKIRAAADAKLAREVATPLVSTKVSTVSERDIVDANAALQAEIIRSHRADISRARSVMEHLLDELAVAAATRAAADAAESRIDDEDRDPAHRHVRTKGRNVGDDAQTLESLIRSIHRIIALERQAFGIRDDESQNPGDSYEARLRRLYESTKSSSNSAE